MPSSKQHDTEVKADGLASNLLELFDPPPSAETPISAPRRTTAATDSNELCGPFIPAADDMTPKTGVRPLVNHASELERLFDPQTKPVTSTKKRMHLIRDCHANETPLNDKEFASLLKQAPSDDSTDSPKEKTESTPLLSASSDSKELVYTIRRRNFDEDDKTPKRGTSQMQNGPNSFLSSIYEIPVAANDDQREQARRPYSLFQMKQDFASIIQTAGREIINPQTWIGSVMFVLFQIVFSLTMGAAITRPHATKSMLGLFTKVASLGIMIGGPILFITLGGEIPALYPTVDLFTAPFLANIAIVVDEAINNDPLIASDQNTDQIFLTTFCTLTAISLFISGTLLVASSAFKLANLGSFLPYPVLAGFFAAVGVMTWTLAFRIDANGRSVGEVFYSGDWDRIVSCCLHHLPSVVVAGFMKYLGPKHPFYVVGVLFCTIGIFYVAMFAFGLSRQTMIENEWFWSEDDLIYNNEEASIGSPVWSPPIPLGWINSLFWGKVLWSAVAKALDPTLSLAFLYLIRCSLHAAALKRNVSNIQRISKVHDDDVVSPNTFSASNHTRKFSETIDIECSAAASSSQSNKFTIEKAKPTNIPLEDIFLQYGLSQFICALIGSFAVTPAINASSTMFELRAEHRAPQFGNLMILFLFYMTDFRLVAYIPKPAFSSLLVLAFIDMTWTWFVKSYFKTKNKSEWLVTPLIVVLAFVVGVLQSVFLGLAMSTFLFVAAFFRTGVVKYVANGITIRSTIERVSRDAKWLDQHGDLIQILVLQNYLFFGNASSTFSYIASMFRDPGPEVDPCFVSPSPRFLIIDLTLVTGLDTSAVDVFSDIFNLCSNHNCKLFLAGLSRELREVMTVGGLRGDPTLKSSERKLRFLSTLDGAVGKAEDLLLENERPEDSSIIRAGFAEEGFLKALRLIDEQHATNAAIELADLKAYADTVELDPNDILYEKHIGDRGLFFIEEGVMRIEMSSDLTTTRAGSETFSRSFGSMHSMKGGASVSTGLGSIQLATAAIKAGDMTAPHTHRFRIARVGPGWVLGSTECLAGLVQSASTIAVTPCSLHFISFKQIAALENDQPLLILKLYKLLSSLLAKRQELTIGQLGTLHSIMNAPPRKRPPGRGTFRVPQVSSLFS